MQPGKGSDTIVVSALTARTGFGKLLRGIEDERRPLVIEKRGTPKAVLLSIRDYVRIAAPGAGSVQDHRRGIAQKGDGQA